MVELTYREGDILIATAEGCNSEDLEALREQIDQAMKDPNFSIIANFPIQFTIIHREKA